MRGQISLFDGKNPLKIDKPIRLIELFAGIGSQAKALEKLGVDFEHYRMCEFDEDAVKSYNAVHGTDFEATDIRQLTADDLGIVDTDKYTYILTYSFPCQDLSKAGTLKGMAKGTRSGLLWEVERLLKECKELPQILVMENVSEVAGARNIADFIKWQACLERLGYRNVYDSHINARDYGMPQNRQRCFMVSYLGDYYYEFPRKTGLRMKASDLFDDERVPMSKGTDWEKAILSKTEDVAYIKQATKKGFIELKNNGVTVLAFPQSANRRGRVIQGGDVCPTIRAGAMEIFKFIDGEFYKISPREAWRFMGFSDEDFDKAKASGVSNQQLIKQAGNSIVVDCLEAIFKEMI